MDSHRGAAEVWELTSYPLPTIIEALIKQKRWRDQHADRALPTDGHDLE